MRCDFGRLSCKECKIGGTSRLERFGEHLFRLTAIAAMATLGCTPVLTSPPTGETGDVDACDWTRPANDWTGDGPTDGLCEEGFDEGETVPDVQIMDQNGQTVSLWQFYGLVVAVDVSTMWCGPCQELAEGIEEVYHEYSDQGFMYLSVLPENVDGETPEQSDLQDWTTWFGISAPVLSDNSGWSYDLVPEQDWPNVLILDREMKVYDRRVEPADEASIIAQIEAALAD